MQNKIRSSRVKIVNSKNRTRTSVSIIKNNSMDQRNGNLKSVITVDLWDTLRNTVGRKAVMTMILIG